MVVCDFEKRKSVKSEAVGSRAEEEEDGDKSSVKMLNDSLSIRQSDVTSMLC